MRIGLDVMGGDYAPEQALLAVEHFVNECPEISLYLFYDAISQANLAQKHDSNVHWIACEGFLEMNEHPTKALKEKPNSTISVGFHYLAQDKIDALISAGNTGAMLVGAAHIIKTVPGVLRPTIPTIVPRINGSLGLIADVGINADCKAENLNQFAVLASAYSKLIFGNEKPKVALLNIGEEEGKGNLLAQAAFPLLKENNNIHFIGNVEGRDILTEKADVIVCDGYTGNIILKFAESIYDIFYKERKIEDSYLQRFEFEQYGGTPVLGIHKPVIVGHGISHKKAFVEMLHMAKRMIETSFCEKIKAEF